jgi:hypothetical protein
LEIDEEIIDSPYQKEIIQYACRHIASENNYGQCKKGKLWSISEKILSQIESAKIYKCQSEIEMSFNDFNQMTFHEILLAFVSGCLTTVFG